MGTTGNWKPGSTVLYRYGRNGRARFVNAGILIEDSPDGLVLWIPPGSPMIRSCPQQGGELRDISIEERFTVPTVQRLGTWRGPGAIRFVPTDREWSISWFFTEDGQFSRWYGNLEAPQIRWETPGPSPVYGIDTADRILDVLVHPDLSSTWKDEDELRAVVEQGLFSAAQAQRIRLHAQELTRMACQGLPPFDGRWTDYKPDPSWQTPSLPSLWDLPHHYTASL
ncbi:DUF402 domain-containing protein [Nonomuraea sp. NPDC050227]|uniref:DUF402 domain-containing protein n=1 Tax=Nonomuraea sp. NPDC050227 TaxID=3364360 RepID=UPI0037B6C849